MAWITKTEAGTWKAGWRDPNRRVRTKTFSRKEDARRFLAKIEADKALGGYQDPSLGKITLLEFWPRFLKASPHLRPATVALYKSLATNHVLPYLGYRRVGSISRLDVEAWIALLVEAGAGPSTIETAHRLLRRVLTAAEAGGLIPKNPARGVKTPKPAKRESRFLTAAELGAISQAVPERERALILLLGLCGLRIGEAVALRVDDLDLLHRRVQVTKAISEVGGHLIEGPTKTGANRSVALPRTVAQALQDHLASFSRSGGRLLFHGPDGGAIRRTNWRRRVWLPALKTSGIGLPTPRPHDLRHTAASLAIQAGAHPKAIQSMLGHSSITVTLDRYGHLFPSLSETLAEAVDVGFRQAQPGAGATVLQPLAFEVGSSGGRGNPGNEP